MIRLGYSTKPRFYQGNSTHPPYQSDDENLTANENLANNQLKDIKAYLTYVNRLLSWMNSRYVSGPYSPKFEKEFSFSESNALSIIKSEASEANPKSKDEYSLKVDLKFALKKRKALPWNPLGRKKNKYKVSWIFERLYVLSKSTVVDTDVWLTNSTGGIESGQTGGDYKGHNWRRLDNSNDSPEISADCTKSWVMLRREYQNFKYASELRGEVYVHELIIHAWRQVEFGYVGIDKPDNWTKLRWFIRQHHKHGGHTGTSRTGHSLADIEGDFLNWYLFFNQDWVDKKFKKGAHDAREVVGILSRNMTPPIDAFGVNWFSYTGLNKRIRERNKK